MAAKKGGRKKAQRKAFKINSKVNLRAIVPPEQVHVSPKDYIRHREAERVRQEIDREIDS